MLLPLLSGLRIDELTNITDFIEAYKANPDGCTEFLSKTLGVEVK